MLRDISGDVLRGFTSGSTHDACIRLLFPLLHAEAKEIGDLCTQRVVARSSKEKNC